MDFDSKISKTILSTAKNQQIQLNSYNNGDIPCIFGEVNAQEVGNLSKLFKSVDGIDGSEKDNKIDLKESIFFADSDKLKDDKDAKKLLSFMTNEAAKKIDYDKLSRKNDSGKHEAVAEDSKELAEWSEMSKKAQDSGYWTEAESNQVKNMILKGKRDITASKAVLAKNILDRQKKEPIPETENSDKKPADSPAKTEDVSNKANEVSPKSIASDDSKYVKGSELTKEGKKVINEQLPSTKKGELTNETIQADLKVLAEKQKAVKELNESRKNAQPQEVKVITNLLKVKLDLKKEADKVLQDAIEGDFDSKLTMMATKKELKAIVDNKNPDKYEEIKDNLKDRKKMADGIDKLTKPESGFFSSRGPLLTEDEAFKLKELSIELVGNKKVERETIDKIIKTESDSASYTGIATGSFDRIFNQLKYIQ